jgi:hypothetical protein
MIFKTYKEANAYIATLEKITRIAVTTQGIIVTGIEKTTSQKRIQCNLDKFQANMRRVGGVS